MNICLRSSLFGWATVSLLCLTSQAATISDMANFAATQVPFTDATVTLDKFNPALGTLIKVTLEIEAMSVGHSIAWDNETTNSASVDLGIGAEVNATGPSALVATAIPVQVSSMSGVSADNDAAADFLGSDSFGVSGGSPTDSGSVMSTEPVVLAAYTGLGETFEDHL